MLKRIAKFAAIGAAVLALAALVLAAVVLARWDRTFEAPLPDIQASTDPAVIAQGRYIAYGPGHCVGCHVDDSMHAAVREGATPPLTGGNIFKLALGRVYTPNLTPDPETGIGRRSDAQLARILRYGVRHDGRAAMPFMEFHNMSDEDLRAVISFLRSQTPVRRAVPQHELTFMGKAVMAFLIRPIGPSMQPPKQTPAQEASVARGAYLANAVAGCAECHTKRNLMDGSYVGARFAGGFEMGNDRNKDEVFVTPNLTPDPKTGRIAAWSEDQFVGRFGAGVGLPGSHMPWRQFQKMSEDDLRAIYRYLRTLEPVENPTGASLQKRKKA